jgi:hypothetical protein
VISKIRFEVSWKISEKPEDFARGRKLKKMPDFVLFQC